jgi:hypothetical protein
VTIPQKLSKTRFVKKGFDQIAEQAFRADLICAI